MAKRKQKIIPHLWYDKEAKEAAEFYTSLLPDSKVTFVRTLNGPMGAFDVVSFELAGQPFMAISAGPLFKFNPSISFLLNFDPSRDAQARQSLDKTVEQCVATLDGFRKQCVAKVRRLVRAGRSYLRSNSRIRSARTSSVETSAVGSSTALACR